MGYIVSLKISRLVKPYHIMKLKGNGEHIPVSGPAFVHPPPHDGLADLLPLGCRGGSTAQRMGRVRQANTLTFDSFLEIISLPMSYQKGKMNLLQIS